MSKIIDYIIAEGASLDHLRDRVKLAIKNGYEPIGSITFTDNGFYFYQPMIQRETSE